MRKRSRIVFIAISLVLIGLVAWNISKPKEPTFNGKPFTLWLEEYTQLNRFTKLDEEHRQAMKALRQMGPKAVPHHYPRSGEKRFPNDKQVSRDLAQTSRLAQKSVASAKAGSIFRV